MDGEMFPELRDATYVTGEVEREYVSGMRAGGGTPVVLGGGDGQCACGRRFGGGGADIYQRRLVLLDFYGFQNTRV